MITLLWVLFALVLVVCYAFFLRRLATIASPARMELADIGRNFLEDINTDTEDRELVQWVLQSAFRFWPMFWAAVIQPIAAIFALVEGSRERKELDPRVYKIMKLGVFSTFVANPFFGLIVMLEGVLISFLLLLRGGIPLLVSTLIKSIRFESNHLTGRFLRHQS